MKNIIAVSLLLAFIVPSSAQDVRDPVLRAMGDELARSTASLSMRNYKPPYFMAFSARDVKSVSASAIFGALLEADERHYHVGFSQVRVGSPKFDNTNFLGSTEHDGTASLAVDGDYYNPRFNFWALSDDAYKAALEKLAQKRAYMQKKNIADHEDDFSPVKPVVRISAEQREDVSLGDWPEVVKRVSAVFKKYPAVQKGLVNMELQSVVSRYRNSEGSLSLGPGFEAFFSIGATAQAEDGFRLDKTRRFVYASKADLPTEEFLSAQAEELGAEMTSLVHASSPTAYLGPVIFEGDAAGRFFEHLLARNLTNMRQIWSEREYGNGGAGEFFNRLGMRVTAPFISVVDDPLAKTYEGVTLFGHYEVDSEGVPAQKVQVVRKGKLVDFLMSRTPTKERYYSNGHGRGEGDDIVGAPSNLFVQAEKTVSDSKLRSIFLDMCREQEQDYCIIIRDIGNFYGPFTAFKVDAKTGCEEPLRGLEFSGLGTRALRDIAAASKTFRVFNYFTRNGGISIIAPSVLVQEVEIKRTEKKPERMPYLGHPYFSER